MTGVSTKSRDKGNLEHCGPGGRFIRTDGKNPLPGVLKQARNWYFTGYLGRNLAARL